MINPTDWRALCAELEEAYTWCIEEYMTAPAEEDTLIQRARAALAQPEPEWVTDEAWQEFIEQVQHAQHVALREGEGSRFDLVECALALWREAIPSAPEPQGPTDEELLNLGNDLMGDCLPCDPDLLLAFARAVLARWGRPAIPPEPDDEVAATRKIWESLAAQLVHESWRHQYDSPAHDLMQRAAEALNNWGMSWPTPTIQPVPVSDPPGPEDCDAEGRCWLHGPHLLGDEAAWVYGYPAWAQRFTDVYSHWLPHWALPVPSSPTPETPC